MAKNTKEYFDSLPEKEIPTEQLATKEELLDITRRLLILERDLNQIKNSSDQYWVIPQMDCKPQRSYQITEDSNSTSTEIAGV